MHHATQITKKHHGYILLIMAVRMFSLGWVFNPKIRNKYLYIEKPKQSDAVSK
jgi:hypothetical protein